MKLDSKIVIFLFLFFGRPLVFICIFFPRFLFLFFSFFFTLNIVTIISLCTEAQKLEQINRADGEAKALFAVAEARAKSIEIVAQVLQNQVSFDSF